MDTKHGLQPRPAEVKLGGLTFAVTIPEAEILKAVDAVVDRLTADYADKNPIFLVILNGAFVFAADIYRRVNFPCQIAFTKVTSYDGVSSTGKITMQMPVTEDVTGRHVVIIEDIVETGRTIEFLLQKLHEANPASVEVCALSSKPERCEVEGLTVKYVGMQLPDAFIVGYGLDYNQMGRELRDIYSLKE